ADCMRMSVSIFTPNAFSMRSAMSPERSALPFSRLDSAGRETLSAAAAAVTDRPAGWIISVRIKSPGWGGFFMGMAFTPSLLVIILQIDVADFTLCNVDAERQTAVASDPQAPCALAVTGQGVRLPRGKRTQFLRVLHVVEKGQHLAELVRRIRRDALYAVFRVKTFQSFVREAP